MSTRHMSLIRACIAAAISGAIMASVATAEADSTSPTVDPLPATQGSTPPVSFGGNKQNPAGAAAADAPLTATVAATGNEGDLIPLKLGMSLDEFKAIAATERKKYPTAQVLCSGDADLSKSTSLAVMRAMPDERSAGIVRCNIFRPDPVNVSWWAPIIPIVDGKPIKSATYYFLPTDGGYRLLFIQAVLPGRYLTAAHQQITDAFGTPTGHQESALITETLITDYWQSPAAWMLIDSSKSNRPRDFTLTYIDSQMTDLAASRGFNPQRDVLYYSVYKHYR